MKTILRGLVVAALLAGGAALAQVHVEVSLPSIRFSVAPPLVIDNGVQVVPDQEEEVFFNGGYYWTRHDGRWFRSRGHHWRWELVEYRRVPVVIARIPPGHYRRWHRAPPPRRDVHEVRYRHDDHRYDHHDDHGHHWHH